MVPRREAARADFQADFRRLSFHLRSGCGRRSVTLRSRRDGGKARSLDQSTTRRNCLAYNYLEILRSASHSFNRSRPTHHGRRLLVGRSPESVPSVSVDVHLRRMCAASSSR